MASVPSHRFMKSYITAQDYETTGQYLFMKIGTSNQICTICDTKGEAALGVLQSASGSAKTCEVALIGGAALVECGESITALNQVTTNTSGEAIVPDTAGQQVLGTALEDGVDGDIIAVMLSAGGEAHAAEA